MNKKRTMKILKTPDTSFMSEDESLNISNDYTVFHEIEKKEKKDFLDSTIWKIETISAKIISVIHLCISFLYNILKCSLSFGNNIFSRGLFYAYEIVCNVLSVIFYILSYVSILIAVFFIFLYLQEKSKSDALLLKKYPVAILPRKNIFCIEEGAEIVESESSTPLVYAFFFHHNHINILLENSNGCFAFKGDRGRVSVRFKEERKIKEFGIYHPKTRDRSSAVNKFFLNVKKEGHEVRVLEGEYDIKDGLLQVYDIPEVHTDNIEMVIESNHGKKRYTALYRLYLW